MYGGLQPGLIRDDNIRCACVHGLPKGFFLGRKAFVDLRLPSSRRKRRTFVLNSTLIVFVEYSFSHVPLPYIKFHVSLKGCSQIIEIGTFING